jgi:hypothetical protein
MIEKENYIFYLFKLYYFILYGKTFNIKQRKTKKWYLGLPLWGLTSRTELIEMTLITSLLKKFQVLINIQCECKRCLFWAFHKKCFGHVRFTLMLMLFGWLGYQLNRSCIVSYQVGCSSLKYYYYYWNVKFTHFYFFF